MEKEQEREWTKAQSIELSVDLVSAAKNQLKFLVAVDQKRYLYDGPALNWAIYRYNVFWLPLLDKHLKSPISDVPLMVPLDCEWIWHCHRLNPVRYKLDCEKLFGRVLDNRSIISSIHETSKSNSKEIWSIMYPEEPFGLDYDRSFAEDVPLKNLDSEKFTSYDLIHAVKRQVPFCYQVSRPHVSDELFLQEALARYKGFLYLIKINKKKNLKHFFVPTYDVDLMWHSHQLHPLSYSDDLCRFLGKVMEHDDTDSDRKKGGKLDTGFIGTTKKWEDTFGLRYWKAGAMNRGTAPSPVTQIPSPFIFEGDTKLDALDNYDKLIQFPYMQTIEVLLELLEIKGLPDNKEGDIRVLFSKKQSDKLFNTKRTLPILSEYGKTHAAIFQCEPIGEFLFELVSYSQSNGSLPNSFKPFGSCSLSLQECSSLGSHLSIDKWVPVVPMSGILDPKPILLHVSLSFTPPTPTPHVFHLKWPETTFNGFCSSPLSGVEKVEHTKAGTIVTNIDGNGVLSLQMRDIIDNMTRSCPELLKEVQYITDSGETHILAELKGDEWCIKGTHYSLKLHKASANDAHKFELIGRKLVRLFSGRKLDYEPKYCENKRSDQDFMTAIEFSDAHPYGRAIAMIDFKYGILKVNDEMMILTSITLAFILFDILKGNSGFAVTVDHEDNISNLVTSPSTIEAHLVNGNAGNAKQDISKSEGYASGCDTQCIDFMDTINSTTNGGKFSGGCLAQCVYFLDTVDSESCEGCIVNGYSGRCLSNSGGCGSGGGKCSGNCGGGGGCGGGAACRSNYSLMADCAKCYHCGVEVDVAAI